MAHEVRDLGIEMERRTYTAELRIDPPSIGKRTPTIRGYAAKFNTLSEAMPLVRDGKMVGTFREQLLPGCFASAIPVSDVRSLFNHDPNLILGRTLAGTLRIKEDDVGLAFENDPPDTSYSRDLQVSMQRGDISQCSFAFNVADKGDSWVRDSEGSDTFIRSIHSISRLYDASPVTYPAYVDTNCALRSMCENFLDVETEQRKLEIEEEKNSLEIEEEKRRIELELLSY